MSKAYQCDRCRCYFSDKKTVYSGAIKIDADFCPECVRSFEKWLKMDDTESDVPNFESEKYVEERTENYNKLLKSGILDCVIHESVDESEE